MKLLKITFDMFFFFFFSKNFIFYYQKILIYPKKKNVTYTKKKKIPNKISKRNLKNLNTFKIMQPSQKPSSPVKTEPTSDFLLQYKHRLIGRSSNSKIFELKSEKSDLPAKVIKQIPHRVNHKHIPECFELKNEFNLLLKISHPHIISPDP